MKPIQMQFTSSEVDRWRDRVHRCTPSRALGSKRGAIGFIDDVGFCFAFKSDRSELPCLLHAFSGTRHPVISRHIQHDPAVSFVWRMKEEIPAERKAYYGRLLKRRPTFVSLRLLPHFLVLARSEVSDAAAHIEDALRDGKPQSTRMLKIATGMTAPQQRLAFDQAIAELQAAMKVVKTGEEQEPFSFIWAPFRKVHRDAVKRARTLTPTKARVTILEQLFRNQLIVSVASIRSLLGWNKKDIFEALGVLTTEGSIAYGATIDGKSLKHYRLVQ